MTRKRAEALSWALLLGALAVAAAALGTLYLLVDWLMQHATAIA